ncbi:hypothetical protein M0R45_024836 [Rubus argutus]|uniref:ornithine decarboxylase n=1 Tax=Rubus argutus TaxID=59490 RepID=A0AAW1WU83_RUBAR
MECWNLKSFESLLSSAPEVVMRNVKLPTPHSNEDNSLVQEIISLIMKQQSEEPFYVVDLYVVVNLMHKWKRNLPLVQPFYAVKCNPNRAFLTALAALGFNFDCASRSEIESVLALGVLLRIGSSMPTPANPVAVGFQFGALPEEVSSLLQAAQTARLKVVGVSFHVGSESHNSQAYKSAITDAKSVFEEAARLGMPPMNVLNIGGGFTADTANFEQATEAVKATVENSFFG